jgi:O-antigen/teichoic acid export membrane protein
MSFDRATSRRIHANAIALLGGDVLNKASTFLVYAMLGYYSGPYEFGQLSIGMLLLYTFHVFAAAGLPTLIARSVARKHTRSLRLLYAGYLSACVPACASVLCMLLFALFKFNNQADSSSAYVVAILALAIIPYAMTMIAEAVIRGNEKMHLIAMSNIPGNAALVIGSALALYSGYRVMALAIIVVAARLLTMCTSHFLCVTAAVPTATRFATVHSLSRRISYSWRLLSKSIVFAGSDGINVIWASLDSLILNYFVGERGNGLLGPSFQILQPILLVYRSVGHSAFPALCAAARASNLEFANLSKHLIENLLRLSIPAVLCIWVLAGDLLVLVYGNEEFREGRIALEILAFTLLLDTLAPVLGHGLWARGRERTVLKIVICNLAANLAVGTLLIYHFGLAGAAFSALLSSLMNVVQHYWYSRLDVPELTILPSISRLAVPTILMVGLVCFLPTNFYFNVVVAVIAYFAVAFFSSWYPMLLRRTYSQKLESS